MRAGRGFGLQLALSVTGGLLLLFVVLVGPIDTNTVEPLDRVIVGSALLLAYALGGWMAVRPGRGQRTSTIGNGDEVVEGPAPIPGPRRRGHHPECGNFEGHTVMWGGNARCAGCTGLLGGAGIGSALTVVYVLYPSSLSWAGGSTLVLAGMALVAVDLVVAGVGGAGAWPGLVLNALMAVGFALVAIGLLELTGRPDWGLIGVILSALWMDTRIQVSRKNHAAVCSACPRECVAYSL